MTDMIHPGQVMITDAEGKEHPAVATTGVVRGRDFPVVWVGIGDHLPVPWPAESVRQIEVDPENEDA